MRIKIGGRVRPVHTTAFMGKKIKKSTATIRRWENGKVIPTAIYRDKLGRRYYLTEEIEILKDLIKEFALQKRGKAPPKEFTQRVVEEWSKCRGKQARTIRTIRTPKRKKTDTYIELW